MKKFALCLICVAAVAAVPRIAFTQMGPVGPSAPQILDVPTGPMPPGQLQPPKKPEVALPQGPEDKLRDPFWPIDYVPPHAVVDAGPAAPTEEEQPAAPTRNWEQAQKGLSIKGIINTAGGKYLANINNQILRQDEKVSVFYDGQKYTWKVSSITAKSVQFLPSEEDDAPKAE